MKKICPTCNMKFGALVSSQKYCSPKCHDKYIKNNIIYIHGERLNLDNCDEIIKPIIKKIIMCNNELKNHADLLKKLNKYIDNKTDKSIYNKILEKALSKNEKQKIYYRKNIERERKRSREKYKKNRKKIREWYKNYYQENKEKIKAKIKIYKMNKKLVLKNLIKEA